MDECEYLFNCDKTNEKSIYNKFQTNFNPKQIDGCHSKVYIGESLYYKDAVIEDIEVIIRKVQREWFLFQTIALYDNILTSEEMVYSRKLINKALECIRESLLMLDCLSRKERYKIKIENELKCLINSIINLNTMKDSFVVKLTSWKECDIRNPIYQYFHTFLEMEYYLLFLNYLCGRNDDILESVVVNLICFSRMNYQRRVDHVFTCSCLKQFWLLIQFYIEKSKMDNVYFWTLFNKNLEEDDPMFGLWLLKEIAALQLIDENLQSIGNTCIRIVPNYELLLSNVKSLLLTADSDTLLKLLKLIDPLLTNYWLKNAKIEIYQIIWDFYSKRLNISTKNYSNLNAVELKHCLNNIISSQENCSEDFEKFLGMLIIHLTEYPSHWSKMKGRIYSQLGPNKLKDLNEVGIVHVMFLFTSLSTLQSEELLKKIVAFLAGLSVEKRTNTTIWNVFTALIFLQIERGLTIEKTAPILLSWIQEASLDHKKFHLIKVFLSNYQYMLNLNVNLQLQQWLFIDSWLPKYLSSCYHSDMVTAFNILLLVLEKVENPDSWSFWLQSFKDHIYPVLKHNVYIHNPPAAIGQIAGKLYILIPHLSTELFTYFTNDNIPPKISFHFLSIILADYPLTCILNTQQENLVIQTWVKICLLTTESCNNLTKVVLKFNHFPQNLKSYINSSEEPFRALIEYLGSDIKNHLQSSIVNKLCEICFGHIDKWLVSYLKHPESELLVSKIYLNMSLTFLHCGPLIYHRTRSSTPLTRLMSCLLLTSDILLGKTPHEYILNSVKKTWHIFYEALVKLKDDSDMFLERILREMITKYMAHFSTTDNPIIKCLQNENISEVILEKISNSYFKHPVKESDSNLVKVIKIMNDLVQNTTSLFLLKLVVSKTLPGLFELIIFHPQRPLALNLIKMITISPLYPQVKVEFEKALVITTEKHLSFNATNYFQMMFIIAKFIPIDIKNMLPKISQQVINVERLRGVGYDISLRTQLETLQNIVKNA